MKNEQNRRVSQSNKSFVGYVEEKQHQQAKRLLVMLLKMAAILLIVIGIAVICFVVKNTRKNKGSSASNDARISYVKAPIIDTDLIPEYSGNPYYEVNDNTPYFDLEEIDTDEEFEIYSDLDRLGRCGPAFANLCRELMPTEERGEIGMIKPSGWHTVKYPDLIEDLYLYNRCHLIAYSLSGENANEYNLITGTRYFNVEGMLPFETQVRNYILNTDNHVLYRVTPIFENKDLVAKGVLMEALSIEDKGKGVCFNVFVYNVQPGIVIDYSDGSSKVER